MYETKFLKIMYQISILFWSFLFMDIQQRKTYNCIIELYMFT